MKVADSLKLKREREREKRKCAHRKLGAVPREGTGGGARGTEQKPSVHHQQRLSSGRRSRYKGEAKHSVFRKDQRVPGFGEMAEQGELGRGDKTLAGASDQVQKSREPDVGQPTKMTRSFFLFLETSIIETESTDLTLPNHFWNTSWNFLMYSLNWSSF